jgi:hypothetical protein
MFRNLLITLLGASAIFAQTIPPQEPSEEVRREVLVQASMRLYGIARTNAEAGVNGMAESVKQGTYAAARDLIIASVIPALTTNKAVSVYQLCVRGGELVSFMGESDSNGAWRVTGHAGKGNIILTYQSQLVVTVDVDSVNGLLPP